MKKKILLLALMSATGFGAFAQERVTVSYFESDRLKPTQGSFSTEFGLTGGLLNSQLALNEGASGLLKFRYFANEDLAVRLGVHIGIDGQTRKVYGAANEEGRVTENNSMVLLNLGIEKHFAGTHRLSPYVGADLLFGMNALSSKTVNSDGTSYVNNLKITTTGPNVFAVGARGVVGADFYVFKHVFIGAEAGLGFLYSIEGKTKTTISNGNTTNTSTVNSAGSAYGLSPDVVTGVRIGFVF